MTQQPEDILKQYWGYESFRGQQKRIILDALANKDILGLSEAYKEIFATKNINENISKLNGSFQENPLVKEVIEFITKDKKRSICTPFS